MSKENICAACDHWNAMTTLLLGKNRTVVVGECRRYAPIQRTIEPPNREKWPLTGEDDWCGEWKEATP